MTKQRSSARRKAKRQAKQTMEVRVGTAGKILIMLAVVAAFVLGVAIFFQVHRVEVQGNRIYSPEQVEEVSGVEAGDNLLMVNRAAVVGNITTRLPYVEQVSVGRILPDTIVIKIEESAVAALIQDDTGIGWYVNGDGRVMGPATDSFRGQAIEVTGFTITGPQAGQQAVASLEMDAELQAALETLRAMEGTGLLDLVTTIQAEKSFDLRLLCGEQYEVLMGGTDELEYKIWYLKEVLQELDPYQMGTIDMTLDEKGAARFFPWE